MPAMRVGLDDSARWLASGGRGAATGTRTERRIRGGNRHVETFEFEHGSQHRANVELVVDDHDVSSAPQPVPPVCVHRSSPTSDHLRARIIQSRDAGSDETGEVVDFLPAPQLRDKDVARVVRTIRQQVALLLRRRNIDLDDPTDPSECEDPALAICHAAAVQGRLAFGPEAGRWARRVGWDPMAVDPRPASDRMVPSIPKKLCANDGGFSLHARVRVDACARRRLEQLCRYAARGPIAQGRLSRRSDGQIIDRFSAEPTAPGTSGAVSPQEFLERLAPQVPPPGRHMVTVLAPAAAYRDQVVPEDRPYREPMQARLPLRRPRGSTGAPCVSARPHGAPP